MTHFTAAFTAAVAGFGGAGATRRHRQDVAGFYNTFATVDIPGGSSTTINGINNEADLVGFFTDAKGNTDGFLALP